MWQNPEVYRQDQNQEIDPLQGGYPQGGYPPPPQGGYPPPPQGGYPLGYPQQGYPPPPLPTPHNQAQPPQIGFQAYGEPVGYVAPPESVGEDGVVKGSDFTEESVGRSFIRKPAGYVAPPEDVGEDDRVKVSDLTSQSVRRNFIRKVYAILMCQLLVTMIFIALFLFHTPTLVWAHHLSYLFWVALAAVVVCLILMARLYNLRRQARINFIFIGIFTLLESFLLGVTSGLYQVDVVLMAVGVTAALCLGLSMYAFQTDFDYTWKGGFVVCLVITQLMFAILALSLSVNRIITELYATVGALLFSLYVVYDTHLIMTGKHKYSIFNFIYLPSSS